MIHFLHKRMAKVDFPISKEEIISKIGEEKVKVDFESEKTVKEIIEPVKQDSFQCAAEFYCALLGS